MTKLPKAIGLCPRRLGDTRYLTSAVIIEDGDDETCDACGEPLVIYRMDSVQEADTRGKEATEFNTGNEETEKAG